MKANETVKKECIYIAYCCTILSVLMQAVFVVCKRWEYTVLLGNLLSLVASVLNFYFMGLTVQKAVEKDESDAKKLMKSSSSVRTAVLFVIIAIGNMMIQLTRMNIPMQTKVLFVITKKRWAC